MTIPVASRVRECPPTQQAYGDYQQLLPGINDEVTLEFIATKISWKDFQCLASVSKGWRHVIRSREVYNAKVRRHSTEALILVSYNADLLISKRIALYSLKEDRCYKIPIPPIGHLDGEVRDGDIPVTSQCVSLGGKIFILGGKCYPGQLEEYADRGKAVLDLADGVYVLDLAAGHSKWKQCASMIEPRRYFECGVLNGKIYVFGGFSGGGVVCGSEVYDPVDNTWSPIKTMTRLRYHHEVATAGAQLFVHGGKVIERGSANWEVITSEWEVINICLGYLDLFADDLEGKPEVKEQANDRVDSAINVLHNILKNDLPRENCVEVYDPVKDDWSLVEGVGSHETHCSFMAKGKLHSISGNAIYVYDVERKLWAHLHSYSFPTSQELLPGDSRLIVVQTALAVDHQLLAIVEEINEHTHEVSKACVFRTQGLGNTKKEIEWERIEPFTITLTCKGLVVDLVHTWFTNYFMHPFEL